MDSLKASKSSCLSTFCFFKRGCCYCLVSWSGWLVGRFVHLFTLWCYRLSQSTEHIAHTLPVSWTHSLLPLVEFLTLLWHLFIFTAFLFLLHALSQKLLSFRGRKPAESFVASNNRFEVFKWCFLVSLRRYSSTVWRWSLTVCLRAKTIS